MGDEEQLADEVAQEILAYLDIHPDAADSIEGVVQWWIVQQRYLRGLHTVGRALDRLVAEGEVERVQGPDGRPLYRAGPARRR
jgi:hypothetical protein